MTIEGVRPPRNLVLCFDGTSNQFGAVNTSVVRLIQILDRDPLRQRVYYDPGVGTLPEPGYVTGFGKRLSEVWGLAFGGGLTNKVEQAYAYLMEMWEPGDQVYVFGFSRGAYTARVLSGMLHSLGLLPRANINMIPYVMKLYKAVRTTTTTEDSNYWKLCNEFRHTFARPIHADDQQRRFKVHFQGLWDTVSSVGWVWNPVSFPWTAKNPSIAHVRHAVSIDERRCFFRQNLVIPVSNQDSKELWFAGSHGDVGGGYPEKDGAAWQASFRWMIQEGQKNGLLTDPTQLTKVLPGGNESEVAAADRLHDSLKGAWWLAEFFPRVIHKQGQYMPRISLALGGHRAIPSGALLHSSVLHRVKQGKYTPRNLPSDFLKSITELGSVPEELQFGEVAASSPNERAHRSKSSGA